MKVICIGFNYKDNPGKREDSQINEPYVFLKPDSAILKKNKPFFIPGASGSISFEAHIVLNICKLGKTIQPQFASRYYDSLTLGINFSDPDREQELLKKGWPAEISRTFDGTAPLGEFVEIHAKENPVISFRLLKNGITVQESDSSLMLIDFNHIIGYISRFYTLKTGDLVFTGSPAGGGRAMPGDRLTGYINDREVFDFRVK